MPVPSTLPTDSTVTPHMNTYPDFDDEWRTKRSALQSAESTLKSLVEGLTGPATANILHALEELKQKRSDSQTLSQSVIVSYKRAKREIAELRPQAAAADEAMKEKKHAVVKAKEYRAKVGVLEKKVVALGRTIESVQQEIVKAIKRIAEQMEPEDNHQDPVPHPQKRAKSTSTADAYSPRAHGAKSSQLPSPAHTNPLPVTPSKRVPAPPAHTTPIRRAKPSNFSKNIPMGMEHKFEKRRQAQPNRLLDPTHKSSFATAVFQSLAASVKAHELWSGLSAEEKAASQFPLMSTSASIRDLNEKVREHKKIPLSKAFVDFVADTQFPLGGEKINTYPITRHFSDNTSQSSASIKDPVKFMKHILSRASNPNLDHTFKAPHNYFTNCTVCNGIPTTCDTDTNMQKHKKYQPPTTATEEDYLTPLTPTFTERELKYEGPAKRDLHTLLTQKQMEDKYTGCRSCNQENSSRLKKTWLGFAYAPEILTFALDRSVGKKYRVTLPLEHDFAPFVVASGEKTKYRLVTFIKTLKSGDCAAYVHAEDGRWWRCVDDEVKLVEIKEWQGDVAGDAVLAMYEKLE